MQKLLLITAMAFLVAACSGGTEEPNDGTASSISEQSSQSSEASSAAPPVASSSEAQSSSSVNTVPSSSVASSSVSSQSSSVIIISSRSSVSSVSSEASSERSSSSSVRSSISSSLSSSSSSQSSSVPEIVWKHCADENEICAFKGRRGVRFGAGDDWVRMAFDGQTPCTREVFGDPAPGRRKTCQVPEHVELVEPEPELEPEPDLTRVPGNVPLLSYSAAKPESDGNQGDTSGMCRTADPDFKATTNGQSCILTGIKPGEWIEYEVFVVKDGVYDVVMNLGANVSSQSASVSVDGELVGTVNSPSEKKWRMLEATVWRIPMDKGERTLRIKFNGNDMQMSKLQIKESDGPSRTRARFASAANDGRDDTALFEEILSEGGVIDIPAGTYNFKPGSDGLGVNVTLSDKDIHVRADAKALFVAKDVDDDLFNLDASSASFTGRNSNKKINISWHGGKIDIRNSYVSTSVPAKSSNDRAGENSTTDGLSIRGSVRLNNNPVTKIKYVEIRGLEVLSSNGNYRTAGGDSGVFVSAPDKLDIRWCKFVGSRDAAIYISASSLDPTLGKNFTVEYVDMQDAYDGIASKRGASNVNFSHNRIKNTVVGIVVRTQNTSRTTDIKINNNVIEQSERAIAAEITTKGEIKDNIIKRLGAPVAGFNTTKNPEKSYQGISLRGVKDFVVEGNTIQGVDSASESKVGIDINKFPAKNKNGFSFPEVPAGKVTIGTNTFSKLDNNVIEHN